MKGMVKQSNDSKAAAESFCLPLTHCERAHKQGEQQAKGEAGSPLSREPDAGLDPRTLGP